MNTTERIVLLFGAALGSNQWMNAKQVVPLVGGGATAWEAVQDALETLERAGYVARTAHRGTWFYWREPLGEELAARLLEDEELPVIPEAAAIEAALPVWKPSPGEPEALSESGGQKRAQYQVRLNVEWAVRSKQPAKPMLFSGPAGLGKTMLGGLVSRELGVAWLHLSMADTDIDEMKSALELAAAGGVLFLDELHAAKQRIRNALLVELGAAQLPFTPIAATTNVGVLRADIVARFRHVIEFAPYRLEEAEQIAAEKAAANGISLQPALHALIAQAARHNPAKIAVLIDECVMLASRLGTSPSVEEFRKHLALRGSDERGVDDLERRILYGLAELFQGTAGVHRLATTTEIDVQHALRCLHELSHDGLVRAAGHAGWTITDVGRQYLSRQRRNCGGRIDVRCCLFGDRVELLRGCVCAGPALSACHSRSKRTSDRQVLIRDH